MAGPQDVTLVASVAGEVGRADAVLGSVVEAHVAWNCTSVLNIVFLAFAALLLGRFFRTRGLAMLRMMNKPMAEGHDHGAAHSHG